LIISTRRLYDEGELRHYQTNICYTRHITPMVIFSVFVGSNNGHNRPFRMSDPEADIRLVPIDGNAQCMVEDNGNRIITGVENALENNIFGEGH
jgi:hypothetical protein